jgi:hypothetical protein
VKLKDWASFCSFFLRSPCTQIFHYQHMTDKSINIEQVKAFNLSASTKTYPPEHIYKHKTKHWTIVTEVLHRRGRYYLVYLCTLVILNSANCHPNPGPQVNLEYPCFICGKEVLDDHAGIHCDDYHCWYHIRCINTVNNTYNIL